MTKSDVALALFKEDYEQMKKENPIIEQYLRESSPIISEINNYVFIYWEWITWFTFANPAQKELEKYLRENYETLPYKFIKLSEDLEDEPEIESNNVGEKDCEIFGITRKIELY